MDNSNFEWTRFLDPQHQLYLKALAEITNGRKETHWMWFIFPQFIGLGKSEMARGYAIRSMEEAAAYLSHPVLGKHLIQITAALLDLKDKSANEIFGSPDDIKLRSCMTLFANVPNADPVFGKVLDRYFNGIQDGLTLQLLKENKLQDDTF